MAAITPLMERVHGLKTSGEIVFVDASGGMDREGLRVFLIMTWSPAGGLPLGVILTSSEAEAVIQKGFQMLLNIMPDGEAL